MELDVNKIALNKRLKAFTLDWNHASNKTDYIYNKTDYIYKGISFTQDLNKIASFRRDGTSFYNLDPSINLITQFNFTSSALNYISDLFIIVDYSKDSDRFLIYRNLMSSFVDIDSKGIFGKEYILHIVSHNESKNIYDKFWMLKQRLK
jgi:hypothetical protein